MGNLMGNQTSLPTAGQSASRFSHLPPKGEVGKVEGSPGNSRFPMDFPVNGKWERENGKTAERKVCTRCGMDGHRASHCPHPLARARVSAAGWNDRCTGCMEGQGEVCACRGERKPTRPKQQAQRFSPWSPAVNVLLLVALFVAVKLKLVFAAVVLAGLLGFAAWRAWA